MSVTEIKRKIHEKIDHLEDEQALQQILALLNNSAPVKIDPTKYMQEFFSENDTVLKRLS
jgi:hypothetical protein